jgi:hypothetical protein
MVKYLLSFDTEMAGRPEVIVAHLELFIFVLYSLDARLVCVVIGHELNILKPLTLYFGAILKNFTFQCSVSTCTIQTHVVALRLWSKQLYRFGIAHLSRADTPASRATSSSSPL